ncbi:unnamed protein product [Adineta ricciae]|uniref:Hint domain-containing protein n=1 Tax=Adineta ricciae TaxID=249248 RepID=A0A814WKQ0_ADIRI|nr:unnamed protein product [Adineta ricciae]CAF1428267.1 unnamed protein product [Adineta ricciae]
MSQCTKANICRAQMISQISLKFSQLPLYLYLIVINFVSLLVQFAGCQAIQASCTALSDCCGSAAGSITCQSSQCCAPLTKSCTTLSDCCGSAAGSITCQSSQCCAPLTKSCTTPSDCCGSAAESTCQSGTCCIQNGSPCTSSSECCSGDCGPGSCVSCFHGDEYVLMADGREKQIKHVRMGDRVKTIDGDSQSKFYKLGEDEVLVRLHHEPNMAANFLIIITESGHRLTLSPDHFVRIFNGSKSNNEPYITAGQLTNGQLLAVVVSFPGHQNYSMIYSSIVSITQTKLVGVYNVLTYSGVIIVSRVVASCFTDRRGTHENAQRRYFIVRLIKHVASIFHYNIYTDEFYGEHYVVTSRLIDFIHIIITAILHCTSVIYNTGVPLMIAIVLVWLANQRMYQFNFGFLRRWRKSRG